MRLPELQRAISSSGLDGWLFFDHHQRDVLAYRILGLPTDIQVSRRWYYFVPATGKPRKLVSRIEPGILDSLPGEKDCYSGWSEQHQLLRRILSLASRIAMQYSPQCSVPYISLVDAGTVELIRGFGVEVVSSADLVSQFEARWTPEQFDTHLRAGVGVDQVRREAFDLIGHRLRSADRVTDYEVQQFILLRFAQLQLISDHGPIVAINEHASNPHFEPTPDGQVEIRQGDLVLIDLWAKLSEPDAVYYDVTWTGYCGDQIPSRMQNIFEVVRDARKLASRFVIDSIALKRTIAGYQVDDVARRFITARGYAEAFVHRTGHSIGTDVHGAGPNMDNLESHDERVILSQTCFSVEPGIYLPEFGIRSEVNVYVSDCDARVTGEEQDSLIRI